MALRGDSWRSAGLCDKPKVMIRSFASTCQPRAAGRGYYYACGVGTG